MNALLTGAPPAPVPAVVRPRGAGERSGAAEARSGAEFGAALTAVSASSAVPGAGQRDRGRPEPTRDDGTPSATTVSPTGSAAGTVAPTTGTPGAAATGSATDDDDAVTSDAATTEPVAQSVANVLTPGVAAALAGEGTARLQAVVGQDPAAGTVATPATTATTGDDATAETPDPTAVAGTGTPTPALSNAALSNAALLNTVSLVAAAMSTAPAAPIASSSATASAASSTAPAAGVVGTPATAPTGAALASGATAVAQPTAPAGQPAAAAAAVTVTAAGQHPAVRHTAAALPGAQAASAAAGTAATPAGHVATAAGADQGGASLPAGPGTVDAPVVLAVPATAAPVSSTPTAAPSAPAMPATAPQPVAQQLARPLFTLAHAGPGEHVLTVQLTPDALGPVTVRAHVTGHGMHVELFAASDAGRDAVRQILPDLRRDSGGSTTLDLSAQNHPADAGSEGRDRAAADTTGDRTGRETDHPASREARTGPATSLPSAPTTVRTAGLDVLA